LENAKSENVDLKTKLLIFLLFINMLNSAELKIADDFKDGDVLSASVFNQIFDTIERVNGTIKDEDLVGVWNCNAISSNSSSGWTQDGFLYKVNDAQINLSASSSSTSLENPYSISTSNPNPFNWSNSSAFVGKYVLLNNHLIIKRNSDSKGMVWDLDLVSESRFELSYSDTASQYANFISCDSTTAVPSSPTSPSATNNQTSILISWTDASTDESGFKIYRKKSGENNFQLISTQSATTYSDTSLSEGESASYYIKSYNQNGDSNQSNVVIATLDSIAPFVVLTTPVNNGFMSRQGLQTISFSEKIKVVCPDGDSYTGNMADPLLRCPTSGAAVSMTIFVDGASRDAFLGTIGMSGLNISGTAGRGSAQRYDANQNNITVTVHKDWIKDLNGNKMSNDYQFNINVNDVLDNPSCPPNC